MKLQDVKVRKGTSDKVRHSKIHDEEKKSSRYQRRRIKQRLKQGIYERRELTNIHLTNNQKRTLVYVLSAPTPTIAEEWLLGDRNLQAARDTLIEIGLLKQDPQGGLTVTPVGKDIMQQENLIDPSGTLTEYGETFLPEAQETEKQNESLTFKSFILQETL